MNLGFLPAFWAKDGDAVLVDDIKYALKASKQYKGMIADVLFVEKTDLASLPLDGVKPWGWDCRVCAELLKTLLAFVFEPIPSAQSMPWYDNEPIS